MRRYLPWMPDGALEKCGIVLFNRSFEKVCLLPYIEGEEVFYSVDPAAPETFGRYIHPVDGRPLPNDIRYFGEDYRDAALRIARENTHIAPCHLFTRGAIAPMTRLATDDTANYWPHPTILVNDVAYAGCTSLSSKKPCIRTYWLIVVLDGKIPWTRRNDPTVPRFFPCEEALDIVPRDHYNILLHAIQMTRYFRSG